jgi:hypothetical protein
MANNKNKKAIALISGGLDSMLAAKVILEQGIHVEGLNFYSGFFGVGSKVIPAKKTSYNNAHWIADQLEIKLHIINVVEEFKQVFLNPKYGYGSQLNPCLDCKIFIVKKALEWIKKNNFDFVISGEVIGQRPMSQRRDTMNVVKRDSGAQGLLLRPLCAKHFPETIPEREGWVDREKLFDFVGRDRKPQIALAKKYGFKHFPQPAGGCLLTEPNFCARIEDLWGYVGASRLSPGQACAAETCHSEPKAKNLKSETGRDPSVVSLPQDDIFPDPVGLARDDKYDYTLDEINLLKVGRHIRPHPHFKLIIGRDQKENKFLEKFQDKYVSLHCVDHPGPLVLIDGEVNTDDLKLAAQITARFTKTQDEILVQINFVNDHFFQLKVVPFTAQEILPEWYV